MTSGMWTMTFSKPRPQKRERASTQAIAIAGIALTMVATAATFRLSQTIVSSSLESPVTRQLRPGLVKPCLSKTARAAGAFR